MGKGKHGTMRLFRATRRKSLFSVYLAISYLVISCVGASFYIGTVAGQTVHDIAVTSVTTNTTVVAPGQAVNVTVSVENQGDFDETFNVGVYYNISLIGAQNGVSLNAGNSTVLAFVWDTTSVPESNNVIKANATVVPGETETTDNEYVGGTVTVTWKKVYISPTPVSENKPNRITISINIFNVTELWGWGLTLRWQSRAPILLCEYADQGSFLSKNGTQGTWWIDPVIDNLASPPNVILSESVSKGGTPVNGTGNLANVTFSVTGAGACVLQLFEVKLRQQGAVPISPNTGPPNYYFTGLQHGYFYTTVPAARFEISPDPLTYSWRPIVGETVTFNASESYDPDDPYDSTPGGITSYSWDFGDGAEATENDPITTHVYTENGTYAVTLEVTDDEAENGTYTYPQLDVKLHDIALVNVTVYPTEVATGATVTINATVLNEGSTMEYLNITAYYNYNPIEERIFSYAIDSTVKVTLSPGKNGTCTIPWKTTGLAPGTYMIGAEVEPIQDSASYRAVSLSEWEADKTDNTIFAGVVTILGTPVHDLAVTAVTVNPANIPFNEVPDIRVTVRNEGNIDETFNATVYCNSTLVGTEEDVMLSAGGSTTLTFAWVAMVGSNTTQEGVYLIRANVTILANETDIADNSRTITRTMRLLPYPKFTYSPSPPAVGQTVTFDASLSYFPGIPPPDEPLRIILSYAWDLGDGTESTEKIDTRVHTYNRRGTYTVTLTVADNRGLTETYSSTVSVGQDHDVAVIDVTPLSTEATTGGQVSINVTVMNQGTSNETVTVSVYYDDTAAASTQSATLLPDANATLTFVWNTAGVASGTYTVRATTSQVTNETYLEDNTLLSTSGVTILKVSSSMTLSASPTTLTIGGSSTLSGAITPNRAGVDVTIWIKASGGDWSEHVTVAVDASGAFSYSWTPPSAGSYAIKVSWAGDAMTQGAETDVQVVDVLEALTSNMFLYSTIALAVLCGVIVVYFMWLRKPKPA